MLGLNKDLNLKAKYDFGMQNARCDNARVDRDRIQFQYTVPDTYQIIHVEQKVASLFNMVHVMLNGGKFSSFL